MIFLVIFSAEFLPPTFKDKVKHKFSVSCYFLFFFTAWAQSDKSRPNGSLSSNEKFIVFLSFKALIKFKSHLYFEEKDLVDKAEKVVVAASSLSCLLSLVCFFFICFCARK